MSRRISGETSIKWCKRHKKRWQMTITRQWTRNIRTLRGSCVSEGENPKNGLKQYLCICSLYCTVTLCIIIQSSVMCQQGFSCHPTQNVWASPPWRNTGVIKKKKIFFLLKHKTDNSVWYLLPNIHFVPNRGARNIYFFFYTQTVMPMCVLIIKTMETGHASKIFFVLENAGGSRRVTRFPSLKWLLFVRLASISTKTRLWSNTFTLTRQGRLE